MDFVLRMLFYMTISRKGNLRIRSADERALLHDALASTSRYWKYKSSTAQMLERCQPVFKPTKQKRRYGRRGQDLVCVYLVRFVSITSPTYGFLKVGITNEMDRFAADSERYIHTVLNKRFCSSRKEALKIEANLHARYQHLTHKPRVPLLSGGNSECFEDNEVIVNDIVYVFSQLDRAVLAQQEERFPRKEVTGVRGSETAPDNAGLAHR